MNHTHDKCYGGIVDRNAQSFDNSYRFLFEGLEVGNVQLYGLSDGIGYKYCKGNEQKDALEICNCHILDEK